jgi:hypothetical protein
LETVINPGYIPVNEMPYCCVPAVLQMILKRRGLPYHSQDDIGYQLGLIVPPEAQHHFTRVRTGPEPKTGYGTRTSVKKFSIPAYFRKNNLPLKLTRKQPAQIQELRDYLNGALSRGDDVIICYNRRLLFGAGDKEHVSLIQGFDDGAGRVLIIDPAVGAPAHLEVNLEKLFKALISDRTGKQKALWIISASEADDKACHRAGTAA